MSKCYVCGRNLPVDKPRRKKYCSIQCRRRGGYISKFDKSKKSIFKNIKEWMDTETGRGYKWEIFVSNLLQAKWQGFGGPYDILWKGKKIDVKSASLYKRKSKRGKPVGFTSGWFSFHKYSRNKAHKDIDYLFCVGIIDFVPYKMWLIPYTKVGKTFVITPNSSKKYDQFLFKI